METVSELWAKLGLVGRVISLKGRSDRESHARENAKTIGLPIDFFFAERHPKGGTYGCFDSHQQVCRQALQRGDKMLLVLEDDFEATEELFTESGVKALRESIEFVLTRSDWDIMYLGVLPNIWIEKSQRVGKYIYKLKPWACTHAMIVNENYMKEIVTWKFLETAGKDAYDWRHRKCERAFAFHPQAIKQYDSPSDIRNVQLSVPAVFRDLPINLASWYALNIGSSLGQSVCVLLVGALTITMAKSSMKHNSEFAQKVLKNSIAKFK